MSLTGFFRKIEPLLSIDIGSTSIKCVELDIKSDKPELLNIAMAPISPDIFGGNTIINSEKVADQIRTVLDANSITAKRVVTCMSSPSVFTKKIVVDPMEASELKGYMEMEAANIVPHSIDAVRLDYHVLAEHESGQRDVLVVAVKNEVIDSYLETFEMAGLPVAVVDVDYFALQNCFELNYPDLIESTVALVNIGARYSSINICRGGTSLFTGDISMGGKLITDALVDEAGLSAEDAERIKRKTDLSAPDLEPVQKAIAGSVESIASEFNRQLSLFWSASGSEGGIDKIFMSGGASQLEALRNEISAKCSIECTTINPFQQVETGDTFDEQYLQTIAPFVGVAIGMGLRQTGDKE